MIDYRRHLRIREITDVRWTVLGSDLLGQGKVLNISLSGMLLVTDQKYDPHVRGKMYIDAVGAESLPFGPKKGRIVWTKKLENLQGYQCGVEFDAAVLSDRSLIQWIDAKSDELSNTANAAILQNFVN